MNRFTAVPFLALALVGVFVVTASVVPVSNQEFSRTATTTTSLVPTATTTLLRHEGEESVVPGFIVTHVPTPAPLRGVYMTSCVATEKKWRENIVDMIDKTELNSIVLDIKDYTGTVSFDVGDESFPVNEKGCYVKDMKEFIAAMHEKGIYVIGRVQVFQDGTYTKLHPELAVKKKDGTIWKDHKGISFIDVGARPYWDHVITLAKLSYAAGFDEVNFDYVRYPSDGDMQNIWFSQSGSSTKQVMLEEFFKYLRAHIASNAPTISADLFGMTTTNSDDLNIGQVLERALPYFDYIAPMVYPSHFPPNFNGWKNPNTVPGLVIKYSMGKAVERAEKLEEKESGYVEGTSTPKYVSTKKYVNKLRPWLQDFDYGGTYDAKAVRDQIDSTYAVGLTSWVLWDPGNTYTKDALLSEKSIHN